jgi:cell wall-associated NlpC family hydrolase
MDKSRTVLLLILILCLLVRGIVYSEEVGENTGPLQQKLAQIARHFLGLPYRWGSMSERRGMDCSGLIKTVFAKLNIELPRTSREQFHRGEDIALEEVQTGDLLFFSSDGRVPDHVGIYIGNQRFVHAEKKAGHVIITALNQPWYTRHFFGARRIVEFQQG